MFDNKRIRELENLVEQLEEKNKFCETLLENLKKENKVRGNLIGHLKSRMKGSIPLLKTIFNDYTLSTIRFLCERNMMQESYLFLDGRGKIITYTSELSKLLKINEDVLGKEYHTLFEIDDGIKIKKSLRKYLLTNEQREISCTAKIKGKKEKLTITKGVPYYVYIDLTKFGGREKSKVLSFIPVRIETPGIFSFFSRKKHYDLPEPLSHEEEETLKRIVYPRLIAEDWTLERIELYESLYGKRGLLKKYGKRGLLKKYGKRKNIKSQDSSFSFL
jgi:hypothetical protein